MGIKFLLLVSRQGKIRLTKWFTSDWGIKEKTKIVRDVSQMVLARKAKMCNVLEFKDFKVVYRRYASLFFVVGTDVNENELLTLEVIHRYVEILDKWFMNVCELDIIFNFQQAYTIIDELLIGGELQDSSKRAVLNTLKRIDEAERQEAMERI
ncbi:AP-1 adaptor complex sigma subunit Aps1 [Batrachochytrium dendrobatidis]|nr:AP-1 adaptor complex sigma subunit Aps1 [Batrachochytrium dendrobatidis]